MPNDTAPSESPLSSGEILGAVEDELKAAQFIDIHTHLYMPSLGRTAFGASTI